MRNVNTYNGSPYGDERARRISADDVEAAKRNAPIVEVAARYGLRLIHSGPRFVSLCPFHEETHPSFTLFPEANRFWCFGCHQGGDVIELVRLLEGVSFREALSRLQGSTPVSHRYRAGRNTPKVHSDQTDQHMEQRHVLLARQSALGRQALEVAATLYETQLTASLVAQQYLRRRGLSAAVAHRRRLGYCSGEGLVETLQRARIPLQVAWDVGLLVGHAQSGRHIGSQGYASPPASERFAGRITLPEVRNGQVSWMTGRLVDDTVDAPRYLHLPGPRPLYGGERIAGAASIVGVEGYFDALTLDGWGIPAFAAGGTAMPPGTEDALAAARLIYLAFDADPPGQAGALAVAQVLGRARTRCVTLPPHVKDVNDLGQRPDGKAIFLACLRHSPPQRGGAGKIGQPQEPLTAPTTQAHASLSTRDVLPALSPTRASGALSPIRPALIHDLADGRPPATSGRTPKRAACLTPQRRQDCGHNGANTRREVA